MIGGGWARDWTDGSIRRNKRPPMTPHMAWHVLACSLDDDVDVSNRVDEFIDKVLSGKIR